MNILVLMTGGTIGSTVKDGWIATDKNKKYALINSFTKKFGEKINFDIKEPYSLLSENLSAENINMLIASVKENLNLNYDGIIITHGTDTLHFSTAAIHLAFGDVSIPIVFVSSNFPLEDVRSNGHANFEGAVKFIEANSGAGVYISYKNPSGKHYFHTATNALAFGETDDSIYSLENKPFGIYDNGVVKVLENTLTDNYVFGANFCESPKILTITIAPGDNFNYSLEGYNAVILRPYHSGTINNRNALFKAFLEKAFTKNIPVFLVNAPFSTTYETVKEMKELNFIPLPRSTFAAVYMRLWAGISENKNLKNLF
ncbi:MAG: asparaginase [Clostridia bacterium]|nr:asparaginase [Clostridia bacterium]